MQSNVRYAPRSQMRQLSSKSTFLMKRAFPTVWLGFLAVFGVTSFLNGAFRQDPMFAVVPILMAIFGLFFFRALLWKLSDSVFYHGDYLVAQRSGVEARIPIANIMNVSASSFSNPKTVTLRLIQASALGQVVSFIPATPFTLNPLAKVAIAEDLMERAFTARSKRVA